MVVNNLGQNIRINSKLLFRMVVRNKRKCYFIVPVRCDALEAFTDGEPDSNRSLVEHLEKRYGDEYLEEIYSTGTV